LQLNDAFASAGKVGEYTVEHTEPGRRNAYRPPLAARLEALSGFTLA
jgi:hypothetical protein